MGQGAFLFTHPTSCSPVLQDKASKASTVSPHRGRLRPGQLSASRLTSWAEWPPVAVGWPGTLAQLVADWAKKTIMGTWTYQTILVVLVYMI